MIALTPAGTTAILRLAYERDAIPIPEATAYYLMRLRLVRRTGRAHRTVTLLRRGRTLARHLLRKDRDLVGRPAVIGHRQHA